MALRPDIVPMLLLGLVVIVVVARVLGSLARKLGQPAVIGEILGGILLGPTLFGGDVTRFLFPADVRPPLQVLADVGVCVFMFLVGLHLQPSLLRGQGRVAAGVSLSAVAVPFGLGALLAWGLLADHPTDHRTAFVLFLGTAMSVTAFPVLARILADRGMMSLPVGGLALACAAVDDVMAWTLLAVVTALAGTGSAAGPWRVLLVVPFAVMLVKVVRPALARAAQRQGRSGPVATVGVLVALGAGLALSALATSWMGLHQIFGAFLFGIVMPRGTGGPLRERVEPWVERLSSLVLLPVFFMSAGMKVDLSDVNATALGELALLFVVAAGGKFAGTFVGARIARVGTRPALVLSTLLNTRGLTELVVLTVGLQIGVLDQRLYSLMVVMALVTTAMTGVLLRFVYPDAEIRRDRERLEPHEAADRSAVGQAPAMYREPP